MTTFFFAFICSLLSAFAYHRGRKNVEIKTEKITTTKNSRWVAQCGNFEREGDTEAESIGNLMLLLRKYAPEKIVRA